MLSTSACLWNLEEWASEPTCGAGAQAGGHSEGGESAEGGRSTAGRTAFQGSAWGRMLLLLSAGRTAFQGSAWGAHAASALCLTLAIRVLPHFCLSFETQL